LGKKINYSSCQCGRLGCVCLSLSLSLSNKRDLARCGLLLPWPQGKIVVAMCGFVVIWGGGVLIDEHNCIFMTLIMGYVTSLNQPPSLRHLYLLIFGPFSIIRAINVFSSLVSLNQAVTERGAHMHSLGVHPKPLWSLCPTSGRSRNSHARTAAPPPASVLLQKKR
jgi:hypothetical protein